MERVHGGGGIELRGSGQRDEQEMLPDSSRAPGIRDPFQPALAETAAGASMGASA